MKEGFVEFQFQLPPSRCHSVRNGRPVQLQGLQRTSHGNALSTRKLEPKPQAVLVQIS